MTEITFQQAKTDICLLMEQQAWQEADERIRYFHRTFHHQALNHEKLHWLWIKLNYRQKNYAGAIWQILPLIFAIPVSWAHRLTGLALPAHKAD